MIAGNSAVGKAYRMGHIDLAGETQDLAHAFGKGQV